METTSSTAIDFKKCHDQQDEPDGRTEPDTSTRLLTDDSEGGLDIHGTAVDTRQVSDGVNSIKETSCHVEIETDGRESGRMIYRISETPPIYMLIFYALQQALLNIGRPLTFTVLVSELTCAQNDDYIKMQILSASLFMVGLASFMVTSFGVRLPIFQAGPLSHLLPLMMMKASDEWRCPAIVEGNTTIPMAMFGNVTIPARELILTKLSKLNGSLMLVGGIHFIIGFTGLVGILIRFIGPVTIVPSMMLTAMLLNKFIVKMTEPNWVAAILTVAVNVILSLCLGKKKTPIPMWSRRRGVHILWYPFHQSFSIMKRRLPQSPVKRLDGLLKLKCKIALQVLLSIIFGWTFCLILTAAGVITDDPKSPQYLARTDARSQIIGQTDWFTVPYPGKLGSFSLSTASVVSCLGSTFVSVLDSIGDYSTCARACRVPPPPRSAFNRGIAVEGLMNTLGGAMGCCHPTVSSGGNIATLSITRVASRRVLQCCGLIYILLACFGKAGAVFITMPHPVIGGISFLTGGLFIGVIMSLLQTIDLNSTRNLAIIGTSIMLGLMIPNWVNSRPGLLDTGNKDVNNFLLAILSNPAVVGGAYACFMDNVIPGSLQERGLLHQMKALDDHDAKRLAQSYEDGPEIYRLPFIPQSFYQSKIVKYIPVFDYTGT